MVAVERYMIVCDHATSAVLRAEISSNGVPEPRSSEVKGLGGEVLDYIVAGTAAINSIAAVLNVIIAAIKVGAAVKRLKVGKRELVNPTAADVEGLKSELGSR